MANEFADGFESVSTAAEMTATGWQNGVPTSTASPRYTGGRYATLGTATSLQHPVTANAQYAVGFAYQVNIYGATIVQLMDATTVQVQLITDSTGHLLVQRNATTIAGPTTETLTLGAWYFIEVKAKVDPSAGTVEVRIGEIVNTTLNYAGNTRQSAVSQITNIRWPGASTPSGLDDVYANNPVGTVDIGYWGDIRVDDERPSADGATTQWTPNTGTTTYDRLNETTPNDTTYIADATAGHISVWDLDDPAAGVTTILAVIAHVRNLKDDAAARTMRQKMLIGGVYYNGTTFSVADTALVNEWRQSVNPATGVAWTVSDVAALKHGVEVIS